MNERKDKAKEIGGFEKQSESAPQKLLVIKNRRFLSDRAEILTQRSFRSFDLNEPIKSGISGFSAVLRG